MFSNIGIITTMVVSVGCTCLFDEVEGFFQVSHGTHQTVDWADELEHIIVLTCGVTFTHPLVVGTIAFTITIKFWSHVAAIVL